MRRLKVLRFALLVLAMITQLIVGATGAISLCLEADGCIRIESATADCCSPSSAAAHDDTLTSESGERSGCGDCVDIVLDAGPRRADEGASAAPAAKRLRVLAADTITFTSIERPSLLGAPCPARDTALDLASSALCARLRC